MPRPRRKAGISPLPADRNGYITFGCMNQFAKGVTRDRGTLVRDPQASSGIVMLILTLRPENIWKRLGIIYPDMRSHPDRVQFVGSQPWDQYMGSYHRIDIGLDPFPYNGGITTCDRCGWAFRWSRCPAKLPWAAAGEAS